MSNSLQRKKNYWEVTYDPTFEEFADALDWSAIDENTGPRRKVCKPFDKTVYDIKRIENKNFEICDFNGDFTFSQTFTFSECTFNNCHFGRSNWEHVKFQDCKFINSTFGLTQFKDCKFMRCSFKKISISATETVFDRCILDSKLILENVITNLSEKSIGVINQKGNTAFYQRYRLEKSKAKIAKNFLKSLGGLGEEEAYIKSIDVFQRQYHYSKVYESYYELYSNFKNFSVIKHLFNLIARLFEHIIIKIYGIFTKWGYGISRIILTGIVVWLLFSAIYFYDSKSISDSLIKGFDILTLVGYSKYDLNNYSTLIQVTMILNLFIGLSWFSLLFPTIFAKISRYFD